MSNIPLVWKTELVDIKLLKKLPKNPRQYQPQGHLLPHR